MTFSEKAKPLKDKSKLTLAEIAVACNISESMVSRYINGQNIPPEDVARKILDFLNAAVPKEETKDNRQMLFYVTRDVYEARIADMQDIIEDLKKQARDEKREKWIFILMFSIVVVFIFMLFYVDITNGNVGWFRH